MRAAEKMVDVLVDIDSRLSMALGDESRLLDLRSQTCEAMETVGFHPLADGEDAMKGHEPFWRQLVEEAKKPEERPEPHILNAIEELHALRSDLISQLSGKSNECLRVSVIDSVDAAVSSLRKAMR